MKRNYEEALAAVIATIRSAINEDWIQDWEMDGATRLNSDLELDSIEFVKIADALQTHYGKQIDMVQWLSGMDMDQLIDLSVGALASFIARARPEE